MDTIPTNAIVSEVWPNFFLVGTMKGGTTSLYYYLKMVPGIYMSPNKEPNYFAAEDIHVSSNIVVRDRKKYLDLFRNIRDEKVIGEASTTYLYSIHAPQRIYETIPHARIVMILRDPIQRAYSQYISNVKYKNMGVHKMSFLEAVKKDYSREKKGMGISILYVERGLYYEQVKRYIERFGRNQVKVLIFEEYIQNTNEKLKDVLRFLGINANPPTNTQRIYNEFFIPSNPLSHLLVASTKVGRLARLMPESKLKKYLRKPLLGRSMTKPEIPSEAKEFLRDLFRSDIKRLESLLDRSLPWKL